MRHAVVCAAVMVAGTLAAGQAPTQPASAGASASFEVASIKRSAPDARGWSFGGRPGGRWQMVNRSIATMIREAYPTPGRELAGAPDWVLSEAYDVNAKAEGDPPRDQIRLMLRALLSERFKLAMHYETREQPVFALVIARRDGRPASGLRRLDIDCGAVNAARRAGRTPDGPVPSNGAPPCAWTSNGESIRFGGLPLSRIVEALGEPDGRIIIDKTGLSGNYEFTLRYTNEPKPGDDTPSLFTALEEQLGLKLVPDRAAVEVVVIDRIERPTQD